MARSEAKRYPRNTPCIPVVEIIAFLVLGQKLDVIKGLLDKVVRSMGEETPNVLLDSEADRFMSCRPI
ncbi:MAG: hypothetical protein EHM85_02745 [Desulfobacteraceae bacterium]|nr:MAG: hypothetical protein EHM85_02745 [Desulfobacteraceae bacterium]